MKLLASKWLLLLFLVPRAAWCFFPTNVGDSLTATISVTVSGNGGTAAAMITPILTQPDGYTVPGPTQTVTAPNSYTATITIPNPELGTYLMGVEISNPTGEFFPTVTLNNSSGSTTLVSTAGFEYGYEAVTAQSVDCTVSTPTELVIPVTYRLTNYPP
jgi:hypothetical protein